LFKNGKAFINPGKFAKVPPVMQATNAPTIYEMIPIAEKPSLIEKFSLFPFPIIQYSAIMGIK